MWLHPYMIVDDEGEPGALSLHVRIRARAHTCTRVYVCMRVRFLRTHALHVPPCVGLSLGARMRTCSHSRAQAQMKSVYEPQCSTQTCARERRRRGGVTTQTCAQERERGGSEREKRGEMGRPTRGKKVQKKQRGESGERLEEEVRFKGRCRGRACQSRCRIAHRATRARACASGRPQRQPRAHSAAASGSPSRVGRTASAAFPARG